MSPLTGGCTCGAVRYRSDAEPRFSFHCQYRQCQLMTGGGHASPMRVGADTLEVEGDLSVFARQSGSGNRRTNAFCPVCTSPVMTASDAYPEVRFVRAGTLDEPARFVPQRAVHGEGRQPWDHIDTGLASP